MENTQPAPETPTKEQDKKRVSDIKISDQNTALNVMVGFLNVAQQRGVYSVEESAKIWECMKFFMPPEASSAGLTSIPENSNESSSSSE